MRRSYILAAIALVAAGIAAFLMFGQNGFGREAKPTPVRDSSGKTAPGPGCNGSGYLSASKDTSAIPWNAGEIITRCRRKRKRFIRM